MRHRLSRFFLRLAARFDDTGVIAQVLLDLARRDAGISAALDRSCALADAEDAQRGVGNVEGIRLVRRPTTYKRKLRSIAKP